MAWWRYFLTFAAFDAALRASVASGVPVWRDWPPFDAHDLGALFAMAVWVATRPPEKDSAR